MRIPSRAHALLWSLALYTTTAAVITPILAPGQIGAALLAVLWWAYVRPWAWTATRRAFHTAPAALLAWPVGLWDGAANAGLPHAALALGVAMLAPLWAIAFHGSAWYTRLERAVFPESGPISDVVAHEVASRCWDLGIPPFDVAMVQRLPQGTFHLQATGNPPPHHNIERLFVLRDVETWLQRHAQTHALWAGVGMVDAMGNALDGAPLVVPALQESAHARLERVRRQGPYGHAGSIGTATFVQAC